MSLSEFTNDKPLLLDEFPRKKGRTHSRKAPPKLRCKKRSMHLVGSAFVGSARVISFNSDSNDTTLSSLYDESSEVSYFDQCFHLIYKLGEGSFGEVFKVKSKDDGKYYAVKKSIDAFKNDSDRRYKLQEVQRNEQISQHQNCVTMHNAWEEAGFLYIQLELCEMSLQTFAQRSHEIPEAVVWKCLYDVLQALKHLHDNHLIHLDIKLENIFVTSDGTFKLGDFGLIVDLKENDLRNAVEGDSKYLAPELMDGMFSKAADVFSLGISVLELALDLDLPGTGDLWHHLRSKFIPSAGISEELHRIICWMMEPKPEDRPTVDDVLSHPLVQSSTKISPDLSNVTLEFLPLQVSDKSSTSKGFNFTQPDTNTSDIVKGNTGICSIILNKVTRNITSKVTRNITSISPRYISQLSKPLWRSFMFIFWKFQKILSFGWKLQVPGPSGAHGNSTCSDESSIMDKKQMSSVRIALDFEDYSHLQGYGTSSELEKKSLSRRRRRCPSSKRKRLRFDTDDVPTINIIAPSPSHKTEDESVAKSKRLKVDHAEASCSFDTCQSNNVSTYDHFSWGIDSDDDDDDAPVTPRLSTSGGYPPSRRAHSTPINLMRKFEEFSDEED